MKKRNLFATLSVLLCLALTLGLAGCGGNKTDASGATGGSAATSGGSAAAGGEDITLSLWHVGTAEVQSKLVDDAAARFEADNPGVNIEVVPIASDAYETKLNPALGSDAPPDIFITWSGGKLFTMADAGKVIDLTPYMDADNYKDKFLDGALSQATYQDKIWGVPVENTTACVFFYDTELFKANNVEVPKTYDDLMTACETFKAAGIAPFALGNKYQWPGSMYYMYLALRLGGPDAFLSAAAKDGGKFNDEPFVQAYDMLEEIVRSGYFNEGYNTLDNDAGQPKQLLYSGKAAMYLMGTWELELIKDENPDFYSRMGVFPFPTIEGGKGNAIDAVGTLGDNFYSISTACEYPDEAFSMIQYLIDDTSTEERIAANKIPPLKGVKVSDPLQQDVLDIVSQAEYIQLWYDQFFNAEIAAAHLEITQAAYALDVTPEEAADQFQAEFEKYSK